MPTPIELPREVAMFPLPNVVLFPGQALPLHIFEERYKAMMRYVLGTEARLLGMQLYKDGWDQAGDFPPTYDIACVGRVGEIERLPEGRYNIILHGLVRVETEEYTKREPFRIARIAPLFSQQPADASYDELLAQLAVGIQRVLPVVSRGLTWEQVRPILEQLPGPGAVADFVAAYLPVDVHQRQELLETLDVEQRLRRILNLLGGLLSVLN